MNVAAEVDEAQIFRRRNQRLLTSAATSKVTRPWASRPNRGRRRAERPRLPSQLGIGLRCGGWHHIILPLFATKPTGPPAPHLVDDVHRVTLPHGRTCPSPRGRRASPLKFTPVCDPPWIITSGYGCFTSLGIWYSRTSGPPSAPRRSRSLQGLQFRSRVCEEYRPFTKKKP